MAQAIVLACAGGLAACGGGTQAPAEARSPEFVQAGPLVATTPAQATPRGGWVGHSGLRSVFGHVLGDGSYYLLYTRTGDPAVLAGFYQGRAAVDGVRWAAPDSRDHAFNESAVPLDITGAWSPGELISARLVSGDAPEARLDLFPVAEPTLPTLAAIAGRYAAQTSFSPPGRFSLSADGLLRGGGDPAVCVLGGQLTPRPGEPAFDLTLSFEGPGCVFPGQVFAGAAFLHPAVPTRIYLVAVDATRRTGILLVGDASPA